MTFKELVKVTGQLPNSGLTEKGNLVTHDTVKTKLNYVCTLWCGTIANPKNVVLEYGTGSTEEKAKQTLIEKILKS